jgi:hypothetical protein
MQIRRNARPKKHPSPRAADFGHETALRHEAPQPVWAQTDDRLDFSAGIGLQTQKRLQLGKRWVICEYSGNGDAFACLHLGHPSRTPNGVA